MCYKMLSNNRCPVLLHCSIVLSVLQGKAIRNVWRRGVNRVKPYLIECRSIGNITGRLIQVQKDYWKPFICQLSPKPETKVSPSSRHYHFPLWDTSVLFLSQSGGHTVGAAAGSSGGGVYSVSHSHRGPRPGGDCWGWMDDPRLLSEVGDVVPVVPVGLQATNGDALAGKLLHLAQRASAFSYAGTAQLHGCSDGILKRNKMHIHCFGIIKNWPVMSIYLNFLKVSCHL